MDDFEIELKMDFLQEARDLLQNTEQSFLQLEADPTNKNLVDSIFRFAHNLKGTSRAVGFGQIAELTHRAENLLLEIKNGTIQVTGAVVSVLLQFNDKVHEMILGLSENLDRTFDVDALCGALDSIIANKGVVEEKEKSSPEEELNFISETQIPTEEPVEVQQKIPSKKEVRKDDETLRVSLNRIEKLNDLVGELVILQTVVENSLGEAGEFKTARSLGKLCKEIQDLSMSLRMIPIEATFQKLSRVVRDTSNLLGKKVSLDILGEDTEIDKTVAENLADPLVHIIRNAIDHGIETPHDRVSQGKSAEGTVEVMAFHEGNFLVIQITDDGAGIDPQRLLEKAKAKGIIAPNSNLTDQQCIELIFHPGFSTKTEVSEVSGRGVGMDVVKTNIEALGGQVKVRSKVGQGSCFRLMLPLTLAIIEGMLIQAGGQNLVVPKKQVQEVIKIDESHITRMTGKVPYLSSREDILPLFYLGEELGSQDSSRDAIAIIISHADTLIAVGVTDIMKQQQVVVKPPTKEIHGRKGIMGTTILGDGKPALIIDLEDLFGKKIRNKNLVDRTTAA
jgi:two-component system chemotaxis sensor kinase CheA